MSDDVSQLLVIWQGYYKCGSGVREAWLKVQVNPPHTTCVTLNGTFDLCWQRGLSPPKAAEEGARQQPPATRSPLPLAWEKSGQRGKQAKLQLVPFSLWNNPCVSARNDVEVL